MSLPTDVKSSVVSAFEIVDDLVIPEGFSYRVIGAWGDQIGDSRFGYNNDYLSFVDNNDLTAMTFRWKMLAMDGEPTAGGAGFSNPDNF